MNITQFIEKNGVEALKAGEKIYFAYLSDKKLFVEITAVNEVTYSTTTGIQVRVGNKVVDEKKLASSYMGQEEAINRLALSFRQKAMKSILSMQLVTNQKCEPTVIDKT